MKLPALLIAIILCLTACSEQGSSSNIATTPPPASDSMGLNELVEQYLLLELSMGQHDPAHVDAYFGPADFPEQAEREARSLDEINNQAAELRLMIKALPDPGADTMLRLRARGLDLRLNALQTRIAMQQGARIDFDDESRNLFQATAPHYDADHFAAILAQIDELLPGDDPLEQRVDAFRRQFIIPPDRLATVFEAAVEECRRRTLQHIDLPAHESFSIEYVTDKPWGGYNWYQGNANSLIQVNTDLPKYIDDAVHLGCHEAYPGHHTYNALLEQNLVLGLGWLEFSLYPLFSPQSLIAEGSANYGVDLAFPGEERVEFEREHLFPLAGLDALDAGRYYRLLELLGKLKYARNEAARGYLNGTIDAEQAQQWLQNYSLSNPEKAAKSISFMDAYRSYVINYNYGKDLVAAHITAGDADSQERWRRFIRLLSMPLAPSDLKVAEGLWQVEGYGMNVRIGVERAQFWQYSEIHCIAGEKLDIGEADHADAEAAMQDTAGARMDILAGSNPDEKWLRPEDTASRRRLIRIEQLPERCAGQPADDPLTVFNIFWQTFEENYPFFEMKGIDWPTIGATVRERINDETTGEELFAFFVGMLEPLQDAHTYLLAPELDLRYAGRRHDEHRLDGAAKSLAFAIIDEQYLAEPPTALCNNQIVIGRLEGDLRYLRLHSFSGYGNNFRDGLGCLENALDLVLAQPQPSGLIIDIRINTGGDDPYGLAIASRLATGQYLAYSKETRMDPLDPHQWTRGQPSVVNPAERVRFGGPVMLLTGRDSVSAAETFTMALMGRTPEVTRVGEHTQGVFSDVMFRLLPNGWRFLLPNERFLTEDGRSFDGPGIAPDIETAVFTPDELAMRRDSAMETAIKLLTAGS